MVTDAEKVCAQMYQVVGNLLYALGLSNTELGLKALDNLAEAKVVHEVLPWPSFRKPLQLRVKDWTLSCFGEKIANDKRERNHRFIEEALELVQSLECTKEEVLKAVEYVFSRDIGDPYQEVGGTVVTLAALCNANAINMQEAAETEHERAFIKIDQIREKQKRKPKW